jgi:head-tail adaptor
MIDAGERDVLIDIYGFEATENAYNEQVKEPALFTRAWAKVEYNAGSESTDERQLRYEQKATFNIRYVPGITPQMVVECAGTNYVITGLRPMGRNQELIIEGVYRDGASER